MDLFFVLVFSFCCGILWRSVRVCCSYCMSRFVLGISVKVTSLVVRRTKQWLLFKLLVFFGTFRLFLGEKELGKNVSRKKGFKTFFLISLLSLVREKLPMRNSLLFQHAVVLYDSKFATCMFFWVSKRFVGRLVVCVPRSECFNLDSRCFYPLFEERVKTKVDHQNFVHRQL